MQNNRTRTPEVHVAAQIARHRLLVGVRRLGVAVSGGADSVALLRMLIPLCRAAGVTPVVLHLDHGLRGAASAGEARFVARLAKRLQVACQVDVARPAQATEDEGDGRGRRTPLLPATKNEERRTKNIIPGTCSARSLEMTAREARQTFFRATARKMRLDAIATGHTADDVAETLLLRLARGSGAAGLSGLRPMHTVAGVKYVRPLLACTHAELRAWLRRKRQTWREDASNRDERIPRNRLRHAVIPWLERNWSPSLRAMLAQSASILRDEDALLDELARQAMHKYVEDEDDGRGRQTIAQPRTKNQEPRTKNRGHHTLHLPTAALPLALQRRIIRLWLLDAGCPEAAGWNEVEGILARMREGGTWQVSLPGGVVVQARAGELQLARPSQDGSRGRRPRSAPAGNGGNDAHTPPAAGELKIPGHVDVAGVHVTAWRSKGIVRTGGPAGALPSVCSLDAVALQGRTLLVRTRRAGDRIRPLGLDGSKSLQDLFVDAKLPVEQRDRLPLLVVDDEVVWVPGYRVARAFAVRGPRAAAVRVGMEVSGQ